MRIVETCMATCMASVSEMEELEEQLPLVDSLIFSVTEVWKNPELGDSRHDDENDEGPVGTPRASSFN